jgi:hypothetical protein
MGTPATAAPPGTGGEGSVIEIGVGDRVEEHLLAERRQPRVIHAAGAEVTGGSGCSRVAILDAVG